VTLDRLATRLQEVADSEGPWLISTPLAHITLPEPAIKLADDAVLWRAELGTEWMEERFAGSEDNSEFDVHRMLGDRISRPTRWVKFSDGSRVDTRREATLLTVEDGVIGLALPRAGPGPVRHRNLERAFPARGAPASSGARHLGSAATPAVAPALQGARTRCLDRPRAHPRRRHLSLGRLPGAGARLLRIPFEAMAALDRRCAQALLSAALALLQSSRASRSPLSEQLRNLHAATEALCEPAPGAPGAHRRWRRLADRLGISGELAKRGYEEADVDAFQERLNVARNVVTHGSDAALLDLGYPADAERALPGGRRASGEDLAFSAVNADLAPVRRSLRHPRAASPRPRQRLG
jgi:hypothetical protein